MKRNGKKIPAAPTFVRNALLSRAALLQSLLDPNGRDLNLECGYPTTITIEQYREMYNRVGVARRVVACMPEECWALDPEVYEQEDPEETEFEQAWQVLLKKFNLFHYLHRIDELSGIGQFGVLLIGIDDGEDLAKPIQSVEDWEESGEPSEEHHLIYLRAFDESVVTVQEREQDINSKRYSLPKNYDVKFQDVDATGLQVIETMTRRVHWTRVLHVADGRVLSEVYGTPRMQPVYNRLLDVRKILGGSAEMFWKGAFPGFSFEMNPELADQGIELDATSIKEQFELYMNGLQRYLAVQGLQTRSLAPQVVSPSDHVETHLREIAMALSVPFRILFGSEQAQLASSQDARTWHQRVRRRQTKYVEPVILRPFIDRLVAMGILPKPQEVLVDWPDLDSPTDSDKAQVSVAQTQALAAYVGGGVDQLIPPDAYLTQVMGMDQDEVDAILEGEQEQPVPEVDENGNPILMPGQEGQPGLAASPEAGGVPAVQFNGAQVQAATQIIKDVAAGEMPRESGVGQLKVFFGLTDEQAEEVMGTAGTNAPVKPNPGLEKEEPQPPGKPPFPPKEKKTEGGAPRPFVGNFDPDQPRDESGKWSDTEGTQAEADREVKKTSAEVQKIRAQIAQVQKKLDPVSPIAKRLTEVNDRIAELQKKIEESKKRQADLKAKLKPTKNADEEEELKDLLEEAEDLLHQVTANFDPDQPRDDKGQWVSEGGEAGIGLERDAKGRVTLAGGQPLPEHLSKIRIPPAWQNVRVNLDPEGALLVKGVDSKGRNQVIYSESHHARQAVAKFNRVKMLDEIDQKIGRKVATDKSEEGAVLRLIRATGIRPGSDADTGADKQAYGATTLEGRHIKQDGRELRFVGKKGVDLKIKVDDPKIAQELKERAERAGPKGRVFDTDDSKLREYVRKVADRDFKPKDFRTLKASRMAAELVENGKVPKTEKEYKKAVREVAKKVSAVLGNTPSIALKSYINPAVFTKWKPVSMGRKQKEA